ncbi:MAG: hypothetical protein KGD63_01780 [Candidatus Lokiarchaeota archaeon]|nr:hypothetical protein [Candidatus Lokiarchaeota archaeon]
MIKELKKGHTLLIKGPTRIEILEGIIEIFGKEITNDKKDNNLVIPSAARYPLYAINDSKLEIIANKPEENLEQLKNNSISKEWEEIKDEILDYISNKNDDAPVRIMTLGISSGKTAIIKYLANNLLKNGLKGGYLDSDLGQQMMFLPTTINIGEIKGSIFSGEDIKPEYTKFIGATFPKGNLKFIVSHFCKDLIDSYIKKHKDSDFILIDSDGWIKTEAGIIYKNFFINAINPDFIILFQDEEVEELKEIEKKAKSKKSRKILTIKESNEFFYERSKEERRFLRQSQFSKILGEYRKMTIPLNDIKFVKHDYDEEEDKISETEINPEELVKLPYHYVIIALLTARSKLIKIGLLFSINLEKEYILLFSDLSYKEQIKIKKILIGSLRLSTKGNHQGYLYL